MIIPKERTHPYPSTLRVCQIPDHWTHESNSQDVAATLEYLSKEARQLAADESIGALFIALDSSGADYAAIYGITGSVAYTWKTAIRLHPLEAEPDREYPIELRHDGRILEQFTDVDAALMHLHNIQSASWSHAIRYEGYSVTRLGSPVELQV
jgi:hypothetical protein